MESCLQSCDGCLDGAGAAGNGFWKLHLRTERKERFSEGVGAEINDFLNSRKLGSRNDYFCDEVFFLIFVARPIIKFSIYFSSWVSPRFSVKIEIFGISGLATILWKILNSKTFNFWDFGSRREFYNFSNFVYQANFEVSKFKSNFHFRGETQKTEKF